MHTIGMLRFMATMEVATGSKFFTLCPGDAYYPIRGYVAQLQEGMFIQCDNGCGTAMFHTYGWMDKFEYKTQDGAFFCQACDSKLYEGEFGGQDYDDYEEDDLWMAQCVHCEHVALSEKEWDEHVSTCEHVALEIRLGANNPTCIEF